MLLLVTPSAKHKSWLPGLSYVGYVDLYGTAFADDFAATGFGTHVALPIIRDRWRADLSEGEARAILEDCVRVLWYRDTRALNKITLAKVRPLCALVSFPSETQSSACLPDHVRGYGHFGALFAGCEVGLQGLRQPQGWHRHWRLLVALLYTMRCSLCCASNRGFRCWHLLC